MAGKKIGYIEITSFAERTAQDFEAGLVSLEEQNIEGLVIDVRGNPGGMTFECSRYSIAACYRGKAYCAN